MVCYNYLVEGQWLGYTYYTAEAVLTLMKPAGGQFNMVIEVDSGAAITLLPRSVANVLGVTWESGEPIQLGGVGGSRFVAYVHILDAYIGEVHIPNLPVAIAPSEDFPPLLGRLGLYEHSNILMNNDQISTCIGEVSTPEPIRSVGAPVPWVALGILGIVGVMMLSSQVR